MASDSLTCFDSGPVAPPPNVRVAVVERRCGDCWQSDAPFVSGVVLWTGDERLMRQHEADGEAEGFAGGCPGLPKPVEVVNGCVDNVLIVDLVRALAAAGQLEAHPGWSGRTCEGAVVDRARTARPVRAVVADAAFGESVQLVRPIEVHATDLHGAVSGRAERVGISGYCRIEGLVVRPHLVFVRIPACNQGHARRNTDWRGAVGRREPGAAGRQAVEVRRLDHRVAVASRDGRIVLVGLDEQDVRVVGTAWVGQRGSPGVREG